MRFARIFKVQRVCEPNALRIRTGRGKLNLASLILLALGAHGCASGQIHLGARDQGTGGLKTCVLDDKGLTLWLWSDCPTQPPLTLTVVDAAQPTFVVAPKETHDFPLTGTARPITIANAVVQRSTKWIEIYGESTCLGGGVVAISGFRCRVR